MNKILVITHELTLSGAPILLLRLMQLLRSDDYSFFTIVHNRRGPLESDFLSISDKFQYYKTPLKKSLLKRIRGKILPAHDICSLSSMLKDVDFILNNTLANGEIIEVVRKYYTGPIATYVHELEYVTNILGNSAMTTIQLSDCFAVPCQTVSRHLQNKFAIDKGRILSLNYFIPSFSEKVNDPVTFKNKFSLSASFIAGGAGQVELRKGTEIFIQVALAFFNKFKNADVQFIWVGGKRDSPEYQFLQLDIINLKLEKKVILLESMAEMGVFFKTIDVFLLTSREDPYPVVVLEAASEKKPSICFNLSGGATEFISDDAGDIVEYLDTDAMATTIGRYYNSPEILHEKGEKAYCKVSSMHQNKDLILSQFKEVKQFKKENRSIPI